MQLRPYQAEAVEAALKAIERGEHPVLALPTASGKSLMIAELCRRLTGRVLVATHRQELLQQNLGELGKLSPHESAGIYSAGLGRREWGARVVFGGVQSIYARMEWLQQRGPFAAVIVDEAHRVPRRSVRSMYRQVFESAPQAVRVGLSATPFRLNDGPIWGTADDWYTHLAYDVGIRTLTPQYLAPLRGVLTAHNVDVSGVRTKQGEYVLSDLSQKACDEALVEGALDEVCTLAAQRSRWLLFCVDVAHTELVTERLQARGIACGLIVGTTPKDERATTLEAFRAGQLRALVGCDVFTEGFNIPAIDAVILLRPTQSRARLIQMVGRGCRQAPRKVDCLVLDFADNLERHAPLDGIPDLERSPARQRRDHKRQEQLDAAKERLLTHRRQASTRDPFDASPSEPIVRRVLRVSYERQASKKFPGKDNLMVSYLLDGQPKWARQWICLEYSGGAQWHARQWFARRGARMPATAAEAWQQAQQGAYPQPVSVALQAEGTFTRVVLEHFAAPERMDDEEAYDDVPF